MDSTKAVAHVSICSGYGGIDLGLRRCINMRTIAYAEIEAFAVELLLARMEEGQLDAAPIWTDLKSFPWSEFRDRVDILSGGYPCQPFSAAGKRLGKDDPRHLWPWIADGISAMRPRVCFFENVEGHISLGLSTVISDLEELGYKVSWGIFSASECLDASGRTAPHQRKRVFILAVSSSLGGAAGLSGPFPRHEGQSGESDDGGGEVMADASSTGSQGYRGQRGHGEGGSKVQAVWSGSYAWPSRPGEPQHAWEPPRIAEPALGGDADGASRGVGDAELQVACDNRTDELRLLGNGVVPQTAEKAWRVLIAELIKSGVKT